MNEIEQIDKEIRELSERKVQLQEEALNNKIIEMFSAMTKEEILALIQGMMEQSPMLKFEVKRLLIDEPNRLSGIE